MTELLSDREMAGIRADSTQIFEDECTIQRPTGYSDPDPNTAAVTVIRDTLYTAVPCYLAPLMSRRDDVDDIGAGQVFQRQYRLALPWTYDDLQIRDIVFLTTTRDPQALNREMTVKDVVVGSNLAYRRFTLIDFAE